VTGSEDEGANRSHCSVSSHSIPEADASKQSPSSIFRTCAASGGGAVSAFRRDARPKPYLKIPEAHTQRKQRKANKLCYNIYNLAAA